MLLLIRTYLVDKMSLNEQRRTYPIEPMTGLIFRCYGLLLR